MPRSGLSSLIPAAGSGQRLGLGPKALLQLNGRPLVAWVTEKVRQFSDEVIVAAPDDVVGSCRDIVSNGVKCLAGGATRQETIRLLLNAADRDHLLILDVARPFASAALCRQVAEAARGCGAAGAFLQPRVPVAVLEDGAVVRCLDPEALGGFQAPQAFARSVLQDAYAAVDDDPTVHCQSTLQLVHRVHQEIRAVPGESQNIKITESIDWRLAHMLTEYLR